MEEKAKQKEILEKKELENFDVSEELLKDIECSLMLNIKKLFEEEKEQNNIDDEDINYDNNDINDKNDILNINNRGFNIE